MKSVRRFLLFIVLLLLFIAPQPTSAHANLERSEPAANAILDEAPTRLRLWFTERPEPRFSVIELLNQQGTALAGLSSLQVDSVDPNLLIVNLPTLTPGVYTVNWKVLSAADGHTTIGAYAFAVGKDQAAGTQIKPFVAGGLGSSSTPTLPSVIVRWLGYLAMAMLMGGFAFMPLIYRPALAPTSGKRARITATSTGKSGQGGTSFSHASGLFMALRISYGLLFLTTLAGVFVQASSAQIEFIGLLTGTRFGRIFWGRLLLLLLLGGLFVFRDSRAWRAQWAMVFWWFGMLLTAGILLTTSLGSHAAASDAFLSIAADWIHLASIGVWVGGLVALLLTLRWLHRTESDQATWQVAALISRFSQIATVCVALLSVSGAFRAFYEIKEAANLVDTPYGMALLGKLVLLLPILVAAALNLLVIERQMHTATAPNNKSEPDSRNWGRLIRRTVGIEIGFVILILFMTGILSSLIPAREAYGAGVVVRGQADDLRILVAINPGVPGLNTFDIYVKDALNRSVPDARKVSLNFDMSGHDMGIQEAVAEQVEPGHYVVSGGSASMIGIWDVEVLVRRAGLDDTRLELKLPLLSLSRPENSLIIISPSSLLVGLELLAFGLILLLGAPRLERARRNTGLVARGGAGIAIGLCLFALLNALNTGENGILALHNPIPADAASIARGQKMYQSVCVACHGESGAGDGPVAVKLNPPPANLKIHMNDGHPDGLLYNWLTNGVSGSAMPAFGNSLSEDERWDIINFIRTFALPK